MTLIYKIKKLHIKREIAIYKIALVDRQQSYGALGRRVQLTG